MASGAWYSKAALLQQSTKIYNNRKFTYGHHLFIYAANPTSDQLQKKNGRSKCNVIKLSPQQAKTSDPPPIFANGWGVSFFVAARKKGIPARRFCGGRGFLAKRRIFAEKVLAIPSGIG